MEERNRETVKEREGKKDRLEREQTLPPRETKKRGSERGGERGRDREHDSQRRLFLFIIQYLIFVYYLFFHIT